MQCGRPGFDPWVGKIPWRRKRQPTPVFWPGEFCGLYSPWGSKESDMSEWPSLSLCSFYLLIHYLPHMIVLKVKWFFPFYWNHFGEKHFFFNYKSGILFESIIYIHFNRGNIQSDLFFKFYIRVWEKAMAPHFTTLAWKIPWMEEPDRLQSMGLLSWIQLSDFTFTFHFHALKKEMATHSSVLAWRMPGTQEPGGLPSMGSHRVKHNWNDLAAAATYQSLQFAKTILYSAKNKLCCWD